MTDHTCSYSGSDLTVRQIDVSGIESLRIEGSMIDVFICTDFECVAENHAIDL